jgi:hypothetical protein
VIGTALTQTNAETFSRRFSRLVYFFRSFALNGGLVSCGFNQDTNSLKRPLRRSDFSGVKSRAICQSKRRPSLN